jgi:hypothetical protein
MVSLARGAASYFEMRVFAGGRADQLSIGKKFASREAASAARECRCEQQLCLVAFGQVIEKEIIKKGIRSDERPSANL